MHKVVMPRIDPGMQTGFIVQWLKKEGDVVQKGEPIAIGEGEKTTFDIVAPEAGVLRRHLYLVKSEVQVTEPIALIGLASEELPAESLKTGKVPSPPEVSLKTVEIESKEVEGVLPVSPAARRLAREQNLDLSKVKGSGPGGRVTREDVLKLASEKERIATSTTAESTQPRVKEENKLSPTRRTIAERLTYSHQTVPAAAITMEAEMDAVLQMKTRLDSSTRNFSATAFFVKALAKALSEDSAFNSSLEGDLVRTYEDVNVAIAIQAPDGLVAPTIPRAVEKTLKEISEEIATLTEKANTKRLTLQDLTGSTVTISNLGPHGVDLFIPIINPPNAAILGIGRISERADAAEGMIPRPSAAKLTLVFDHRVGDGIAASKLLSRVKELLESPEILTD